jgi:rubrerythrin
MRLKKELKMDKKPVIWRFYGCSKCGFFKSSTKMMGKCPKCGGKLAKYREFPGK